MPWIKLKTIDKGYYDPRTGKTLNSIEGLRNRPNIDPFTHWGIDYPEAVRDKKNIKAWHEKGRDLLLNVKNLITIDSKFLPEILTDDEAKTMKEQVFGIKPESIDSGVIK